MLDKSLGDFIEQIYTTELINTFNHIIFRSKEMH